MSTKKTPVVKTEPAASKKTTKAPAPTVKKTVVKKDTATPAPAPDATAKELAEAQVIIAQQATVSVQQKKEITDWKKKAQDFAEEASAAKAKLVDYAQDTRGWLDRGNKWAFAAIPTIILGVWLFFVYQHNNNLQKSIADLTAANAKQANEIETLKAGNTFDSAHAVTKDIERPDKAAIEKKSPAVTK
jgi:hypothetical protein